MLYRTLPRWAWPLAGVVLAIAGGSWLVAAEVATQRASFDTDARIARGLAALFNPVLYPGTNRLLQISQEELGYLAGVSRQRANQALKVLEDAGLVRSEYGGINVLDLEGLRRFGE